MNYETFYQETQLIEKGLKEKLVNAQKYFKNAARDNATGDLKALSKDLASLRGVLGDIDALAASLQEQADGFDVKKYLENGDFAKQMIQYCDQFSVDVKGEFPTYEMFPFKVKIDPASEEITVNRRRHLGVRPLSFVQGIRLRRDKYMKVAFNTNAFLNELAEAYDTVTKIKKAETGKTPDKNLVLRDLYEYMAPMQRTRREYDIQNFAFDLARLYNSDAELTKDGRKFEFGPGLHIRKMIRILDQNGMEQFIETIKFFK